MSSTPSPFILIEDPSEVESFIIEGARTCAGTVIWTKDKKTVVRTNMMPVGRGLLKDSIYLWAPRTLDIRSFLDDLNTSEEGACYLNTSLTRAHIFYKSTLQYIEKEALIFRRPEQMYKIQRRRSFRLPIPDGYTIRASFASPIEDQTRLELKIYDLSSGGLSLLVPIGMESRFPSGSMLRDMKFKIRSKTVSATGEVRYIESLALHPTLTGFKMGIQFKDVSKGDLSHINAYVQEESRKYFSRFV